MYSNTSGNASGNSSLGLTQSLFLGSTIWPWWYCFDYTLCVLLFYLWAIGQTYHPISTLLFAYASQPLRFVGSRMQPLFHPFHQAYWMLQKWYTGHSTEIGCVIYEDKYQPLSFIKYLQFSCMVRSFSEETPQMRMNQFPCGSVVTIRDLFVQVARRKSAGRPDPATLNTTPKWLPTTYNLKTELSKFVSYYQQRLKKCVNILFHLFFNRCTIEMWCI